MGPHRASLRAIYFLSEEKTEAKLVTDGPIYGFTVHLHVAAKPAQYTRVSFLASRASRTISQHWKAARLWSIKRAIPQGLS
jgi:hypothetical protein